MRIQQWLTVHVVDACRRRPVYAVAAVGALFLSVLAPTNEFYRRSTEQLLAGLLTLHPVSPPVSLPRAFVEVRIDPDTERHYGDRPVVPRAAIADTIAMLDKLPRRPHAIVVLAEYPRTCFLDCDSDTLQTYLTTRKPPLPPVLLKARIRVEPQDYWVNGAMGFVSQLTMEPPVPTPAYRQHFGAGADISQADEFAPFALLRSSDSNAPVAHPTLPLLLAAHLGIPESTEQALTTQVQAALNKCRGDERTCPSALGRAYNVAIAANGWMRASGMAVPPPIRSPERGSVLHASRLTMMSDLHGTVAVVTVSDTMAEQHPTVNKLWRATAATLAAPQLDCTPEWVKHALTVVFLLTLVVLRHAFAEHAEVGLAVYGGSVAVVAFFAFECLGGLIAHLGVVGAFTGIVGRAVELAVLGYRTLRWMVKG